MDFRSEKLLVGSLKGLWRHFCRLWVMKNSNFLCSCCSFQLLSPQLARLSWKSYRNIYWKMENSFIKIFDFASSFVKFQLCTNSYNLSDRVWIEKTFRIFETFYQQWSGIFPKDVEGVQVSAEKTLIKSEDHSVEAVAVGEGQSWHASRLQYSSIPSIY